MGFQGHKYPLTRYCNFDTLNSAIALGHCRGYPRTLAATKTKAQSGLFYGGATAPALRPFGSNPFGVDMDGFGKSMKIYPMYLHRVARRAAVPVSEMWTPHASLQPKCQRPAT